LALNKTPKDGGVKAKSAKRVAWDKLTPKAAEAATRFYESVIGWTAHDGSFPGQAYTLLAACIMARRRYRRSVALPW